MVCGFGTGLTISMPLLHRLADGRAAGRLGAMDRERLVLQNADLDEFLVSLVNLRQQRAAGHRDDGVAREFPTKLLGDLEAHALRAFGVIGTQVDVHEAPAVFAGDLGAEPVDLVVSAVDADDIRAINERAEHFALLEIGGNEDVALQAGRGGVGGDGIGEVAGGGAGDDLEAEFPRAAQRHGDDAILEGEGGVIDGVVLDVKLPRRRAPSRAGRLLTSGVNPTCAPTVGAPSIGSSSR